MCGIIGIVSRPSQRPVPEPAEILAHLDRAVAAGSLTDAAGAVRQCDDLLKGVPGVRALIGRYELAVGIIARLDQLDARVAETEHRIESDHVLDPDQQERIATELIDLRDATWAVRHDRLRTAREVESLVGRDSTLAAVAGYLAVQQALSALDRLEVRGRDSAGLHLFVWNHGLSLSDPVVRRMLRDIADDMTAKVLTYGLAEDADDRRSQIRVFPRSGDGIQVPVKVQEDLGGRPLMARLCDALFVYVIRSVLERGSDGEANWLRGLADPQVGAALGLVHERPDEDWSVVRLAARVGMSRSAFAEKFTRVVGESPIQYLIRWRLEKAAGLLRSGEAGLADIASRVSRNFRVWPVRPAITAPLFAT